MFLNEINARTRAKMCRDSLMQQKEVSLLAAPTAAAAAAAQAAARTR